MSRPTTPVRDMAFGLVAAAFVMWLTFFGGPGTVELATLAAAGVTLVWFTTCDRSRLVDDHRRPHVLLFGLAVMGVALLVTGAAVLASGTTFLTLAVGGLGVAVGLVRAIRHGIDTPIPEE
jgi:hypothetical protein